MPFHSRTTVRATIGLAAAAAVLGPLTTLAAVPASADADSASSGAVIQLQQTYPDNISGWIAEAQAILTADGDQVPSAGAIAARAMTESSDDPLAENHWDGNQALYGGTYGLMQVIQPTFDQWALPGYTDIMNPVDNIVAAVRYANATYGSFESVAYGSDGY
jgi:hypothetical protein